MPLNNLIKRLVKGSPLTATEHDGNLTKIQNAFNGLENRFDLLDAGVTSTTPPSDTSKTWNRLNPDGVIEGQYRNVGGQWLRPHPIAPSTQWAMPYIGDASSIDTLDGGSAAAVSDTTGPFWEIITAVGGKFPVGVGAFPSGLAVTANGTGGEESVTITTEQMPTHSHSGPGGRTFLTKPWLGITGAYVEQEQSGSNQNYSNLEQNTGSAGGSLPHNNLPPYYGMYFIRRTARKFIVAT